MDSFNQFELTHLTHDSSLIPQIQTVLQHDTKNPPFLFMNFYFKISIVSCNSIIKIIIGKII